MERLKILGVCLMVASLWNHMRANEVNVDAQAVLAWTVGSTYITQLETGNNNLITNTKDATDSIQRKTAQMALWSEGIKAVMADCDEFGKESVYYQMMVDEMAAIVKANTELIAAAKARPGFSTAAILAKGWSLTVNGAHIVNDFCNIVNNGKIDHPFKLAGVEKHKDGGNYMQREKRLRLTVTLLGNIQDLRRQLQILVIGCRYWGLTDLLCNLDYRSWATLIGMDANARYSINLWNRTFNQ
ncbi:MAG: hypothetical protein NC187_07670 [Candidatus Amulumruptor caecigallinarius]|nr:hypothetical protein [Candidatus Amulumruptor caecigallinarius]MCM1397347.1 hypothetical protein [Candidatus Amulumruptor caecigallinarius]MCM1453590.1 hypothetical protein [bacterium]